MTGMVERVARAIIRGRASRGDDLGPPLKGKKLERYVDQTWRYWVGDAESAIEAMRDSILTQGEGK